VSANSLRLSIQATSIATKTLPAFPDHLPQSFFARSSEVVAPELIGCLLVSRQPEGELLWGVIVETEAYSNEAGVCRTTVARALEAVFSYIRPNFFWFIFKVKCLVFFLFCFIGLSNTHRFFDIFYLVPRKRH